MIIFFYTGRWSDFQILKTNLQIIRKIIMFFIKLDRSGGQLHVRTYIGENGR